MRTPYSSLASQIGQNCDCLNSFTQSHFICKYSIKLLIVQCNQPVETYHLVLPQPALEQKRDPDLASGWLCGALDIDH